MSGFRFLIICLFLVSGSVPKFDPSMLNAKNPGLQQSGEKASYTFGKSTFSLWDHLVLLEEEVLEDLEYSRPVCTQLPLIFAISRSNVPLLRGYTRCLDRVVLLHRFLC